MTTLLNTIGAAVAIGLALSARALQSQPEALQPLASAGLALESLGGLPGALFLGGFGLAALRVGAAPRWLSAIALIAASAAIVGILGAAASGPWSYGTPLARPLTLLWVLITSVLALREREAVRAVT